MEKYKFNNQVFDSRDVAEEIVAEHYDYLAFDEYLDSAFGSIKIFKTNYPASQIFKKINETGYYDNYSDWLTNHYSKIEKIEVSEK